MGPYTHHISFMAFLSIPISVILIYLISSYLGVKKLHLLELNEKQSKLYVTYIVIIGALLRLSTLNMLTATDEAVYLMASKQLYQGLGLYGDFFLAHPPLYPVITSWIFNLLGVGVWQAKLIPVILSIGSIPLVYAIAKRFYGVRSALLSTFIFSISAGVVEFTRNALMYGEMIFFTLLAVIFLFNGLEKKRYHKLLLSGLFMGVATMYRLFALVPLLSIVIYLLIRKEKSWKYIPVLFTGFLLVVTPVLVHYKDTPMLEQVMGFHVVREDSSFQNKVIFFLKYGLPIYPLLLTLGLLGIWMVIKEGKKVDVFFVLWALIALSSIFLIRYRHYVCLVSYITNTAAPLAIVAGRTADWLKESWKHLLLEAIIVSTILIHITLFQSIHLPWYTSTRNAAEYIVNSDDESPITGFPALAPAVAFLADRGLADNVVDLNIITGYGSSPEKLVAGSYVLDMEGVDITEGIEMPLRGYVNKSCTLKEKIDSVSIYECK